MKEAMIELKDFSFQYKAQSEPTLKNLNLTIYKGEKVLIVGPSGSGKSTIGQCLNGIIPNIYKGTSSGQFLIQGNEAFDLSIYEKSHLVSTVLQDTDGQFIGLSVAEDLAFALENDMVELGTMKERVQSWAERLDLMKLLDHRPQDLSGGQKQRVSLAGVLIDESPILLFDEPLANLDPKSGQDIIDLIDQIHEEQGTTTIIIEHRLEDVLYRPVDRVILINQGQVLFNGRPDELLRTTLLAENGIREPLYLTALRQLGQDINQLEHLDRLDDIQLDDVNCVIPEATFTKTGEAEELLKLEQISFAYQENHPILKNISLTIPKGQRLAIVGKNGAGKSTLAKAICGFITTEGQYTSRGEDIKQESVKERAERVGYVLQNPNQMISTNMIFDEVALGLRLRGISEEDIKERVYQALKTCGLYEFRKWPISALSYGQKKRVTIASILVLGPEILVLDEPTAGQDQRNYTDIMEFLDSLQEKGHTIVMITHDMQLMLDYSDRALVVSDGQILADLSPAELFTHPDILQEANLKETSIFALANRLGMDPLALTQFYMQQKGVDHEASISRLP
ncbi:ABC transporter ATP-binding protein [Streptococcus parasanguinis]|uniref:ABC transporter ATP-binding protein n=1 Tax=Streptococcus TaxID=1301 RepID=UPI0007771495|nr:ABC transporter ATP-binding protein [Streptococcus parasanguinis]KXT89605.1 Duplicated ATPase component MtsB of energizing module of methionine-regulated ECF transporter [Streptococcus parasanguinis]MCB6703681.1 ABC transporter ATP-binding protein [Streptococcus parasanguinis]MCB6738432.1 ABC transporter ATP-binding protein [Streptococcus parasanguinis]MCB7321717.1 ABC transporter ATP-binding protein [Streptococcus parasanguinis]MCB7401589.1 ABC transporter ATP-binding protein [Streptococcu